MATQFNVNQYWLKRGQTYAQEKRLEQGYHRHQEAFLFHVLEAGRLPVAKLLEIGCGFGRVTRLLSEKFQESAITALDLSPDQLANARRYCAPAAKINFQ